MKFAYHFALAMAALCIIPAAAQQPEPESPQPQQTPTQQPEQATPQQPQQASPQAAAPSAAPLSPITAELTSKLDSKTAKAGDTVVLKTTSKATMPDGTVIPKGSKIMGHVTEAQAHGSGQEAANGRVTLQFDQAQLKSGQSLPIQSALQSVAPASGSADSGPSALPMSPGSSGSPAPSGGSSGGTSTGSANSASSRPSAPSPGMESAGAASPSGPAPGTTVAQHGSVVIKTTSVPGVLVACSASGRPFSNASGALISAQQDVKLEGGTKVMLAIASMPAGANSR